MSLPTDHLREKITGALIDNGYVSIDTLDAYTITDAILALLPSPPLLVMRDDGTATALLPSRNDVIEEAAAKLEDMAARELNRAWSTAHLAGASALRTLKDPT